ncbi:MAG TPA: MFS transporter, partial [Acidimicrobiia bacterium]
MKTFATVWVGQVLSQVGSTMTGFALSIFVYLDSGSVTRLAVVLLAANLPAILLAPVAGVWVDRLDRRIVMMVSDSAAGLGALALLSLAWRSELTFWPVVLIAALGSAAGSFQEPAYRASIVTLVPTERLGRANGMIEMGPALGTLIAPAIAGALIVTVGVEAVLAVDVVTFIAAVGTLAVVRFPRVAPVLGGTRRSMRQEVLEGLHYLRDRSGLLGLLGMSAGLNFFLVFANVLWLPLFLGFTDEATIGLVMTGVGLAMVAGSLAMSAWGGPERLVRGMVGLVVVAGLALSVSGLRPSLWLAAGSVMVFMFFIPLVNGISQTLWQRKVEPAIQGRVFSTRRMIATIASPIAYVVAGPLADGVFEPLLAPAGPLAGTVGEVMGVGAGRGSALLVVLAGVGVAAVAATAWSFPAVRNIERDVPDAVVSGETLAEV